ncbi:hypothetical protein HD597_012916 [Nonomuraea thailandensis]|uniref:Ribbon-helix-helix domain-containing protein n=1 Tax=Nonomuraea thailandensis TaxID=1188745 RepID=A0A9X2K9I9_9ACTN|nr:hypothetical protein [Nonomuraea thailandensis]MCP2365812.1 hypothetical protein [Nonomuraea thailandensis]
MSGSKPGPPPTVVHKYSQSFTDAELYARVKKLTTEWGLPMTKVVERLLAEALHHTRTPTVNTPQQLPLDRDTPNEMVAA